MAPNKDHDLEEPLIFDGKANPETTEWGFHTEAPNPQYQRNTKFRRSLRLYLIVLVPWTLLILLGSWDWIRYQKGKESNFMPSQLTYSPVQDLLEYELRMFHVGLGGDMSEYMGEPSPELDAQWSRLYPSLYQLIPQEQAAKLWTKTVIFPHDEERRYVIELDVFHQLHCLNQIRKSLRPDYYKPYTPQDDGEDGLLGPRHLNHCIETLRQALMCASDVTVYTWEWDEKRHSHVNQLTTPHTCRNFDRIREWADVNGGKYFFDGEYREMNDPLNPDTWEDGYSGE